MAAILFIASKRRNYRRLFIDFIVSVNIYFLLDALCRQKFTEIYQRNIKNSRFYCLVTSFVVIGYEHFSFPVLLDCEQFGSLNWIPNQIHCSFIDLLNMLSLQFGYSHPLELLDTAWCLVMKISATRQQWQLTYAVIHSHDRILSQELLQSWPLYNFWCFASSAIAYNRNLIVSLKTEVWPYTNCAAKLESWCSSWWQSARSEIFL